MKKIIIALSFAAIAAMAGGTGASAFSSPLVAHESAGTSLTPVTFYGKGQSSDFGDYDYDRNRRYYKKNNYREYKHYRWNKYWYGYRGYCYYHPYSRKCQSHSW